MSNYGKYTGLHQHSIYSPLDGYGKVEDIVVRCKEQGQKGVCITDHGNAFCWYDLWEACKKHDMKPIFANEMYIAPQSALIKEKIEGYKPAYHLIVIAMNDVGFKNLMRLTSWSWLKGKYYKPRVDFARLREFNEGLIVLQACIGGLVAQLFLDNKVEEAEDTILKFKNIFGDRYYLEMQYSGLDEQKRVNKFFKEMSDKHDVDLVITSDAHYVNVEDSKYHTALVSINTGGVGSMKKIEKSLADTDDVDQDESGLYYTPNEYYIKTYDDLNAHFNDEKDLKAFDITNEIADRCNVEFPIGNTYIPKMKDVKDEAAVLLETCTAELEEYLKKITDDVLIKEYKERLRYEFDIIDKMEFPGYFLVVAEYIQWARDNDIMVGDARGSAAGSLIAFLMKITTVDPIKYNLLFERFLSRGRAKLPLIEFKEYPINKWREENA